MAILRCMLVSSLALAMSNAAQHDEASQQLYTYKSQRAGPDTLTTTAGRKIGYDEATSSLNKKILDNEYFIEVMTHSVRELIPQRFVHAKGVGARGTFEVTKDISDICKAKFLSQVGKKTPVAGRWSSGGIKGDADTLRLLKALGLKFYTEEGNFDFLGIHLPAFAIKDPIHFFHMNKALKRNPVTDLYDRNTLWDFVTLRPESLYMMMYLLGSGGIPQDYQHTPAFAVHTYQVYNEQGESSFVRFHLLPDQGLKNYTSEEAQEVGAADPDSYSRALYNSIAEGNYPSWTWYWQVLSMDDVKNAGFDVFDVTLDLPEDKYPLREVGRVVLDQNVVNQFAEMEQIGVCPGNLVPGILGAPDKMFEARRFAYRDAQTYRLGANFGNIAINAPLQKSYTYNRNGVAPVRDNGILKDAPNYYPNSFFGPAPLEDDKNRPELIEIEEQPANNFYLAQDLYRNRMSDDEKKELVENIVEFAEPADPDMQQRVIEAFAKVDTELSEKVKVALAESENQAKFSKCSM